MKRLVLTVAATATVALFGWVTPVQATPITFVETAMATGTLGSTAFTNALVTVTATADTTQVSSLGPGFLLDAATGTPTVSIGGLGTYNLTGTAPGFTQGSSASVTVT